jgi:hypothetical protein
MPYTDVIPAALIHNDEAEQAVLSAVLTDCGVMDPLAGMLRPADFFTATHQQVFAAMLELWRRHVPIDLVTLVDELKQRGTIPTLTDEATVAALLAAYAPASYAPHYAQIVRRDSLERQAQAAWQRGDSARAVELRTLAAGDGALDKPVDIVCLADIAPERVAWLWPGRIPLGKLSLIDGDPGLGKSLVTLDLAARLTTGRAMPDSSYPDVAGPAGVVLLTAEDGLADTVRPRLDASGADARRVHAFRMTGEDGLPAIPDDVERVERAVCATGASLVVVDPLMAFLSDGVNANRDQHMRAALVRLAALAERCGAAVVVVRHLNKGNATNVLYRGGGSIGIIGAARSAMLVAPDPDDERGARRVLAMTKVNLAAPARSLAYHVDGSGDAPRIVWEGETPHVARDLLVIAGDEQRSARDEATTFLRDVLGSGEVEGRDVMRLARDHSIAPATLRRAATELGIVYRREGFGRDIRSYWRLPFVITNPHSLSPENVITNGDFDHECEQRAPQDVPAQVLCAVCGRPLPLPDDRRRGVHRECAESLLPVDTMLDNAMRALIDAVADEERDETAAAKPPKGDPRA